jgi:Tol biopolymer transport system component
MSLLIVQNGLHRVFLLLTTTLVAGWGGVPMSWSPDSQWLSYTVAPGTDRDEREPGWLFDTSREGATPRDPRGPSVPKASSDSTFYRIWTSHRDDESSALIEESAWPLTAPSWSRSGRALAFCRFVPVSTESHPTAPRGRLEVVIQQSLERKRTVLAVPDFELELDARAMFPQVAVAWSPDGQYLAFPRPGRNPSILIIKVESRRLLQTIEHAVMPAWSPDGSKLAFIRGEDLEENRLQVVERVGQTFVAVRPTLAVDRVKAEPFWTSDGRSIYVVVEKVGPRSSELGLERVMLETGEVFPIHNLSAPEIPRRAALIRGLAIDFDRQEERCFFSVDIEGRDTDVVWSVPRERGIFKRFHPVDGSMRIGSLAVSPDGRAVAVRFGPPTALTLPAIYDLTTEQTSLVMPDEAARGAWLAVLVRTARVLLLDGLPAVVAEGRIAGRPTLLPLPGEISPHHSSLPRLARLGRIGSAVCNVPRRREAGEADRDSGSAATPEDRLFFDYLQGDFAAADADLNALEPRVVAARHRLALLSLRAQILWSKGDTTRSRAVADYLITAEGGPIHRFEETPLGPVLTAEPDSGQSWARYLSSRTNAKEPAPASLPPSELLPDHLPPDLPNPFAPPDHPEIERGRAAPFVPFVPGGDLGPFQREPARPAAPVDRLPPQPQLVNPPRRRRMDPLRTGASEKPARKRKSSG